MANEKRLIDANALRVHRGINVGASLGGFRAIVLEKDIRNAPIVDAVEVVHGRWVGHYDVSWIHKRKWLTGYDCSVCGKFINTMTPYCPYCGAKMDGGAP